MFLKGIVVHIIFLYSIFDIYFKSPIVQNVVPYLPQHDAVANRLVLLVVDGLRAESFVNYTTMKYLRSVANSNGRWGISNTQVPTESRPGHIALIAGFYEDPSAVFRGWKENPVDFDSVFNQSTYTWSWGAYDIVNIFTKRITDNHITAHTFDPYEKGFSTDKNTTRLDAWVFDQVKKFFHSAKSSKSLEEKLKKDKIIFFLHLLGTDTSGHTHKPKTPNFLTTLTHVDEGIQEIEKVIREYYGDDGKTTFLMTSDHGMTDWGSHGSGDNHETETPYVIWGSGVQTAKWGQLDPLNRQTLNLSLEHRLDINQVDLAPLMSTILSIPVPVNSIGQPVDGLLDMTLANKAKSLYSVSRQLSSQYDKKRLDVETNALPLLYYPYEPFTKAKYNEIIMFTEQLLKDENYKELIDFSKEIVNLSVAGLRYYHDYYQKPLLILVTLSFLGWAACLLKVLASQKAHSLSERPTLNKKDHQNILKICTDGLYLIVCFIGIYLVFVQSLPIQYYIYVLMPLLLWRFVLFPFDVWIYTFNKLTSSRHFSVICIEIVSYVLGCFALGMSFTYRWTLSIPLLGMGLWPYFSSTKYHLPRVLVFSWSIGCLILSMFAFMPVVGKNTFIELVLVAGLIWLIALVVHIKNNLYPLLEKGDSKQELILTAIQMTLLAIALQNIYVQSKRFERGTPVSYLDQAVAWIIAVLSPILPLLFYNRMVNRLVAINTSLLTFYLMVSVAHEGLFMVALTFHVMCWILIEYRLLSSKNERKIITYFGHKCDKCVLQYTTEEAALSQVLPMDIKLNLCSMMLMDCTFTSNDKKQKYSSEIFVERSISNQDFRRAFFFVSYIILAFFGTGNIASLNSFEIRWVTCFVTSFRPFLITTLILLKTFAPFMVVGCSFVGVHTLTEDPMGCLNIIVLIYSNLMGIQLLYNVRNTGSWLEIGTSISQFVIVQMITVFIVIINKIARLYTNTSIGGKIFKSRKKYI